MPIVAAWLARLSRESEGVAMRYGTAESILEMKSATASHVWKI